MIPLSNFLMMAATWIGGAAMLALGVVVSSFLLFFSISFAIGAYRGARDAYWGVRS